MSGGERAVGPYDLHGLQLILDSDQPAVREAMELRLRGFGDRPSADADCVRLVFVAGTERHDGERVGGRPVYETPHGVLSYVAEGDALVGRFGGVHLSLAATEGTARLEADAFTGRDLYIATHPLATISLMELLKRRLRYPLHAACLATPAGDGVLIAGPSGAGKSTLTIALARAGLAFLSDDTVFLEHVGDGVEVLGFSDALGISTHPATRFDALRRAAGAPPPPGFPKRLVRIEEVLDVQTLPRCTPRVLVVPEIVAEGSSRLEAMDPKEALLRLVPDVLLTDPTSTQAHLAALAALLAQVECHRLASGPEIEHGARLVAGLL